MREMTVALAWLLLVAAGGAAGPKGDADAAFDRLKRLVGEWKSEDGKDALTYELIAGGTALLERETSASRPTMVTLYHRDGQRLVLTHYCMAGNQPRMEARSFDAKTGELAFEFIGAGNLPNANAGHMRNVTFRFLDEDRFESVWQFYKDGKVTLTERARYARVR